MKEKDLPKSSRSDSARVDALRDADIDFSDIPELGEAFFRMLPFGCLKKRFRFASAWTAR